VFVVTGGARDRPIVLMRERLSPDPAALWHRLGREPVDLGELTERELESRFPGTKTSVRDLFVDLGVWRRVYLAAAALLLGYIAVAWLAAVFG
jgi:hypothetical protein